MLCLFNDITLFHIARISCLAEYTSLLLSLVYKFVSPWGPYCLHAHLFLFLFSTVDLLVAQSFTRLLKEWLREAALPYPLSEFSLLDQIKEALKILIIASINMKAVGNISVPSYPDILACLL